MQINAKPSVYIHAKREFTYFDIYSSLLQFQIKLIVFKIINHDKLLLNLYVSFQKSQTDMVLSKQKTMSKSILLILSYVDFCQNESRFMPPSIFHLNRILMLMTKINIKQYLFHTWKIRAEGYSTLFHLCSSVLNVKFEMFDTDFHHQN